MAGGLIQSAFACLCQTGLENPPSPPPSFKLVVGTAGLHAGQKNLKGGRVCQAVRF
jgi:hypothetical protein